jgi:hypothetical protein
MLSMNEEALIMEELILGAPPSLTSMEANDFREKVREELAEMKKKGIIPEIPYDFD